MERTQQLEAVKVRLLKQRHASELLAYQKHKLLRPCVSDSLMERPQLEEMSSSFMINATRHKDNFVILL